MAFHRTYIADMLGALKKELAYGIQIELAALMSPCIGNQYEGNWVYFASVGTKVTARECLVYFMPPGKSIVKDSPELKGQIDFSFSGNTNPNSGASEVYVTGDDAKGLARIAFHELMHNKLRMDNRMHEDDGLRTGKEIHTATKLTDKNKRDMAAALQRDVPQWDGGISILGNGIHDNMSEWYKF